MRRREFTTLLAGAAVAWPVAAGAQHGERMRRMSALMTIAENDIEAQPRVAAFRRELRRLGWTEDGNLRIDYRWAVDLDQVRPYAAEIVNLSPDVILVQANPA
jgi:putative ABC transport system substrate-binding protein